MDLITRAKKGSKLTWADGDNNITKIEDAINEMITAGYITKKQAEVYQTAAQVNDLIKKFIGFPPENLDTLQEIAERLLTYDSTLTNLQASAESKANKDLSNVDSLPGNVVAQLIGPAGKDGVSILHNRLINSGFTVNQRAYVTNTTLAAGAYAHDRWKAGASGAKYTFTQGSLGVPITVTIATGSLIQVIGGEHLPEGGAYILSWQGTAQARINGGAYSASPIRVTSLTAGANASIEFGLGTVTNPYLIAGTVESGANYRPYDDEMRLCYRRLYRIQQMADNSIFAMGFATSSTTFVLFGDFPVPMAYRPTGMTAYAGTNIVSLLNSSLASMSVASNCSYSYFTSNEKYVVSGTVASGLTVGMPVAIKDNGSFAYLMWEAEL